MLFRRGRMLRVAMLSCSAVTIREGYHRHYRQNQSIGMPIAHCEHINSIDTSSFVSAGTYPANNPSEDRVIASKTLVHGWDLSAVFDGHGGWNVSEFAMINLPLVLEGILETKIQSSNARAVGISISDSDMDACIVKAFNDCEKLLVDRVRPAYELGFGQVASVGSCVLLALRKNDHLILANCGDCRAVLGSEVPSTNTNTSSNANGTYSPAHAVVATRLTRDHNSREALEAVAMQRAHPTEALDDLIRCKHEHACYVKGRLQLTRSLGDLYLKSEEFNAPPGAHRSRGRHIPQPFTPPYVLHTPEVTHVRLAPEDKFVILATDGLWDFLSDSEAVEIVRASIEQQQLLRQQQQHQDKSWHLGRSKSHSSNETEVLGKNAAAALIDAVLQKAAQRSGLTLEQLQSLPQGSSRRNKHDDTTVVVKFF